MKVNWLNIDQSSGEWLQVRVGLVTASHFKDILAFKTEGKWGKTALKLSELLAKERATNVAHRPELKTLHTDRGTRLEPFVIKEYEKYTSNKVTNGGIYIYDGFGASPDGHVNNDGLIEIKTRLRKYQDVRLRNLNYDPGAYAQIQGNLLFSGKKYCDFISYCEEYEDFRSFFVTRVYPDDVYQKELLNRLEEFENLIEENLMSYEIHGE